MNRYKLFLKKYVLTFLALFFIIAPMLIFLVKAYEHETFDEIVEEQLKRPTIYGTALNQNNFLYKLELIKHIKPEIIALGSSRTMQFREEFFSTSFVNAGGGMNYLTEGIEFLNNMVQFHKPKYIILGLDFWWFTDNREDVVVFPYHNNTGDKLTIKKLFKPIEYLYENKISYNNFINIIKGNRKNKLTNYDNLGIKAIISSEGFRKDGSYLYSAYLFGKEISEDTNFKNTFFRIDNDGGRMEYGKELSKKRILLLDKILKICKKYNIKVIIVIPPLANSVIDKMNLIGKKYKYINEFQDYISKLKVESFNFHNPKLINSNDCEFIDGIHGGDVTYQRMLLYMYNKKSLISGLISNSFLEQSIINNAGRALSIYDFDLYNNNKEIDFLKLKCQK